jgi:hypothetical protein
MTGGGQGGYLDNEHAATNLRCCAHEEAPGMAPSCRNLCEDLDDPPGLSDSAAREAEDEDLVVGASS